MSAALAKGWARILGGGGRAAQTWLLGELKTRKGFPGEDPRRSSGSWAWWLVLALSITLEESYPASAFGSPSQLWCMGSWLGQMCPFPLQVLSSVSLLPQGGLPVWDQDV